MPDRALWWDKVGGYGCYWVLFPTHPLTFKFTVSLLLLISISPCQAPKCCPVKNRTKSDLFRNCLIFPASFCLTCRYFFGSYRMATPTVVTVENIITIIAATAVSIVIISRKLSQRGDLPWCCQLSPPISNALGSVCSKLYIYTYVQGEFPYSLTKYMDVCRGKVSSCRLQLKVCTNCQQFVRDSVNCPGQLLETYH